MPGLKPHSQADYVVTTTLDRTVVFTSLTGGEDSREVRQVMPGARRPPVNVDGPFRTGQVTITKPLDRVNDRGLIGKLKAIRAGELSVQIDVTKQAIDANGRATAGTDRYLRCSLVSYNTSDVNADTAEPAMLTVTLQPEERA